MDTPYGKRLNRAALQEFRKFWSGFRLLVTWSGLVAPGILQVIRIVHSVLTHEEYSMISIVEAIESGAIGLVLSTCGTYLYSRRKGAESLDAEQSKQMEQLAAENAQLKIKPYDLFIAASAKEKHDRTSAAGKALLRLLLEQEEIEESRITIPGLDKNGVVKALNECLDLFLIKDTRTPYIERVGSFRMWSLVGTFREPLRGLLYHRSSDTMIVE